MKLYIARDTETICLFLDEPKKAGSKDFFVFVGKEFLELKDETLKNHIGVGEYFSFDIPLPVKGYYHQGED